MPATVGEALRSVAIVGAGAIGRAYAALLARDGHAVALWSPSGASTGELPSASDGARSSPSESARRMPSPWPDARSVTLEYDGVLAGTAIVTALDGPAAIAAADVVIVALPAPAYASVLPVVAAHLSTRQTVFVSAALSLVPLWLSELAAAHGTTPLVGASGTTVATARARPDGVTIMTIRTRLGVAAVPASKSEEALEICRVLFGDRFDRADSVLAVTLTNINPVAHAAMALSNITRIERAEAWPQYYYLTPVVARLIEAMDAERRAVAAAFGQTVTTIEAHFQRSFDVPQTSLADIAAELHRRRGGPPGPTSLDTRFVLEDVPYGLVFNAALARMGGVEVPVTASVITLLSTLHARDFREANPLLAALQLTKTSPTALLARCIGNAT